MEHGGNKEKHDAIGWVKEQWYCQEREQEHNIEMLATENKMYPLHPLKKTADVCMICAPPPS